MFETRRDFKAYLRDLAGEAASYESFHPPGSMFWTVNREAALHFAGPRALLLQLAHPRVAQGVSDHSNFLEAPFQRAFRTFSLVYAIAFGTREKAVQAAARVYAVHDSVHGTLEHESGLHAMGSFYDAHDPELLHWVHATLVDSSLEAYNLFVRRLTAREEERFYQESLLFGRLFGVAAEWPPATVGEFRRWMNHTIHSNLIAVSPVARRLSAAIMGGPWMVKPISPILKAVTAGLLPERLREGYGLPWHAISRWTFRLFVGAVQRALPRLPDALRAVPMARSAEARYREAATPEPRRAHQPS